MNLLVRIDREGSTFSVFYTEDVKFGTFNIRTKKRSGLSFKNLMPEPEWLSNPFFIKFVDELLAQYVANQVLDVYDDKLHAVEISVLGTRFRAHDPLDFGPR